MKFFRVFFVVSILFLLWGGIWFYGFDRSISLPDLNQITKIEVCQNNFKQHSQQISYIEESTKIQQIYEFIEKRKKGWEPLLYSPPAAVVIANFYASNNVLFQLYLMKSSNFLIRNNGGAYLKSLRNDERNEFFQMLGIENERLVSNF